MNYIMTLTLLVYYLIMYQNIMGIYLLYQLIFQHLLKKILQLLFRSKMGFISLIIFLIIIHVKIIIMIIRMIDLIEINLKGKNYFNFILKLINLNLQNYL